MTLGTNIGRFRHSGRLAIRTHDAACSRKPAPTTTAAATACRCAACIKRRGTTRDRKAITTLKEINAANSHFWRRKER